MKKNTIAAREKMFEALRKAYPVGLTSARLAAAAGIRSELVTSYFRRHDPVCEDEELVYSDRVYSDGRKTYTRVLYFWAPTNENTKKNVQLD